MRFTMIVTLVTCVLGAGCGSGVQHRHPSFLAVGTALPVEVAVRHEPGEAISGTVHFRTSPAAPYVAQTMNRRADQLWAMLPTEQLGPDDVVEYYIDVERAGEFHALATPGAPYRVTFLDEVSLILTNLRDTVHASDDDHPVRIVLLAGGQPIDQPEAVLLMPGMPAEMVAPMEPDGRGNWQVVIPARAVSPGPWRYAIEVAVDGDLHRFPIQGYRSFDVKEAQVPATGTDARQD